MDKNTIYGLLLMAAVFFGFMWLTPRNTSQTDEAQEEQTQAQQPAAMTVDSLTSTEREWLARNIMEHGEAKVLPDSTHVSVFNEGALALTAAGDSVWGTVAVDGEVLQWSDVCRADLKKMTVAQQRKAVEAVRAASLSMGKFGKFSRFLTGADKTVTMENDVIKLSFDAKGGVPTRAELKKYDTEYSADENANVKRKVVIFDKGTNSLDFEMPLPQSVNTSQLYFTPRMLNDTTLLMALDVADGAYWGIEYSQLEPGNTPPGEGPHV